MAQHWHLGRANAKPRFGAPRAFSPEAVVELDGYTYHVGGLVLTRADDPTAVCATPSGAGPPGSCPVAYLNRSQPYIGNISAFQYVSHATSLPTAPFPWTPAHDTLAMTPAGLRRGCACPLRSALPRPWRCLHTRMYASSCTTSCWTPHRSCLNGSTYTLIANTVRIATAHRRLPPPKPKSFLATWRHRGVQPIRAAQCT